MKPWPSRRAPSRRTLLSGCVAIVLAYGAGGAMAQSFPQRPLRLIVPFPAGGGTDAMARALGDALMRDTGQSVIVDNKSGAGTVIGNDAAAKSAPDGYTLLLNTSAISIVPSLHPKLPYAHDTALAPVILLGRAPNVAVVRANSPLTSAADLLAQARAQPGKLAYASAGNGTSTHLAAEYLKSMARLSLTHVPYRGAAPAMNDLLAGQVDVAFGTMPSVAPLLATGKLRALAITSPQRSPSLGQVPTFAEAGVAGYDADVWYGVFVPGETPPALVEQLHALLKRAAQTEAFKKRAAAEGLVLTLEGPQETAGIVRMEVDKWRKVIQAQSIKME